MQEQLHLFSINEFSYGTGNGISHKTTSATFLCLNLFRWTSKTGEAAIFYCRTGLA
jgi:hypothetical protein